MIDRYEEIIIEDIEKIQAGSYFNMTSISECSQEIAKQVLQKLLEWACQPQNTNAIMISRKKIGEINKCWLESNLIDVATKCIDLSDEWEYRRLLELIDLMTPKLKEEVLGLGRMSGNEDIEDVVEEYWTTMEK